jgi:predicted HicB family RNase H-like nuclease
VARRESSVTFTTRCEQDKLEAIERAAEKKGISRNSWVNQQLEKGLSKT